MGKAGLATGYYLRRTGLSYIILDDQPKHSGAGLSTWYSLQLFSPAEHSSLPGWPMPKSDKEYPDKGHMVEYLTQYEARYQLPVERPVTIKEVNKNNDIFTLDTTKGTYTCRALVSATGTWKKPYIPNYPNQDSFRGYRYILPGIPMKTI